MRNLQLLELVRKEVLDERISQAEIFDITSDSTYFVSKSLYKHDFQSNTISELCPETFANPLCIKFLSVENKICIGTQTELFIFDPDGNTELQSIPFTEDIAAISWSPTEETVVTVSQSNNITTCHIDYEHGELFIEAQCSVNVQIPDTVYVGWGSRETQFRGSAGKYKPDAPVEAAPVNDRKPTISWRGNGEMFVVNYWTDNTRAFLVFETSGKALYRSEQTPGIQPQIAWRPTGNMIASVCVTGQTPSLVVFEKNGQKRFDFELNLPQVVQRISWSLCASILTILTESDNRDEQNIHLFASSNYTWCEKQRLTFRRHNRLLNFDWLASSQLTFTLRVVTEKEIVNYTFISVPNVRSGLCGVVKASTLQITDFKDAIIPPPMCSSAFVNDFCINSVFFSDELMAIVDSNNCVKIFILTDVRAYIYSQNLDELISDVAPIALTYHHFVIDGDFIYFAAETKSGTLLHELNYQTNECKPVATVSHVLRQFVRADEAFGLTHVSKDLYTNECADYVIQDVTPHATCRLTWTGGFYVNDLKLSDCASSFLIFGEYLLYTTKKNRLFCARFRNLATDAFYSRNAEQGSVLIAAIPDTSKIVLQLPRGNLETISCRLISIDILDALLEKSAWRDALRFVRLEKLNANLLFDLDPARFLAQVDAFVDAAATCNELNAVVMEFERENVLKTLYKNWGGECAERADKIAAIFRAFFAALNRVDYLPLVTTAIIVNVNFFTLRDALIYVQDLYRRALKDARLVGTLNDAINTFKSYGCAQEKLYEETLLLYDLELARFVAGRCQLDPRVYEPQIDALATKRDAERRYEINVFAKRFDKAVAYMLRAEEFDSDDVRAFIKAHGVAKQAYAACPRGNRHFKAVSRAFADTLPTRDAALILKRAGLLEDAFDKFVVGLHWREALLLADELDLDDEKKSRVALQMAHALVQRHVIKDAAILFERHANDDVMAVRILTENYVFEEAFDVAKRHKRTDLIPDIVSALVAYKNYLKNRLEELRGTFEKHRLRLAVVRMTKLNKLSGGDDDDRDDLYSEVGSTISRSSKASRTTTASAKNRRKEERKKQDLREGGVFEDIALIRALHGTIREISDKGEDVHNCCTMLLQESDISYKELKSFYHLYSKIESEVRNGVAQIWPPHYYTFKQTYDAQELVDLENFQELDLEFRTPPKFDIKWKMSLF